MSVASRALLTSAAAAALLVPAGPAAADTETVVLTAPYAADAERTSCGELAGCLLEANADRTTGAITAAARVVGGHVDLMATERTVSLAAGTIVASHAVAEVPDTEVTSITYRVNVTLAPTDVEAVPHRGRVNTTVVATHDGGVPLEGTRVRTPFIGGIIRHNGGTTSTMELVVTGGDGAPIPPGQISLAISIAALVESEHTVTCAADVCVSDGAAVGSVSTGFTVNRVDVAIERV